MSSFKTEITSRFAVNRIPVHPGKEFGGAYCGLVVGSRVSAGFRASVFSLQRPDLFRAVV
jgi:hypothetical protein